MTVKALHDFLCVEEPSKATTTSSGLILVADKEATFKCVVYSAGPGTVDDRGRELSTNGIKAGDIVHLPKEVISGATKFRHEGRDLMFIKPPQVLAWEPQQ